MQLLLAEEERREEKEELMARERIIKEEGEMTETRVRFTKNALQTSKMKVEQRSVEDNFVFEKITIFGKRCIERNVKKEHVAQRLRSNTFFWGKPPPQGRGIRRSHRRKMRGKKF